jgi:acyl-CoA carboxylase subunit alpha
MDFEELEIDGTKYPTTLTRKFRERKPGAVVDHSVVRAAVPGRILALEVEPGQAVARGQGLLVLEAMKMENRILACGAGTVATIEVGAGTLVAKGDVLLTLTLDR